MAWDSTRPVPWQRLMREWLVYVAIMAVVFLLFFSDGGGLLGIFAGLLVSGPLYLGFGYVLAKLGYQRKTWKQLRSEAKSPRSSAPAATDDVAAPRPVPAPTRRTGGGGAGRPGGSRKKRR